jgi:hypothetical protein
MGGVFKSPPPPAPPTPAPTQSEVSQATAMDQSGYGTDIKTKRRGRSATILTSSTGVQGEATLGKQSLLGS